MKTFTKDKPYVWEIGNDILLIILTVLSKEIVALYFHALNPKFKVSNIFFQPVTDEEVEVQLQAAKKEDKKICPYAGCVSDAFECLFQKLNINFCTSKFLQMYGRYTFWHDFPSCTEMLNDFERLVFIERVHICANEQGNHEEKLNEIAQKLIGSKQKAGLLWYSKDDTKHCVTVYVASNGTQMEIEDKNMNQNYITDLPSVREFILFVLKCDSEGKPLIETQWKDYCHTDLCENESQQLSEASKYLE